MGTWELGRAVASGKRLARNWFSPSWLWTVRLIDGLDLDVNILYLYWMVRVDFKNAISFC